MTNAGPQAAPPEPPHTVTRPNDEPGDGATSGGGVPSDARSQVTRFAAGASLVAAAAMFANVLAYGLRVGGNKLLEPAENGAMGALVALLTVATVLQVGTQTAVAVRTAVGDTDPDRLVAVGLRLSAAAGLLLALSSPAVAFALHVRTAPVLALALATVPINASGVYLGRLQGAERFGRLAVCSVLVAVGRSGGGLVGLMAGRSAWWALVGVAVGGWVAVVAVRALVASARLTAPAASAGPVSSAGPVASGGSAPVRLAHLLSASSAMLAMYALVNADLLLARGLLSDHDGGAYAVGAILTNAAFWAPQVVAVVALPRLARGQNRALVLGVAVVGATGAAAVAGTALLGDLVIAIIGSDDYADLAGRAWLFAATGAAWALVNLLLTARIAAGARWVSAPLWAAVAVEALLVVAWRPHTLTHTVLAALATALASVVVAAALHRARNAPRGPRRRGGRHAAPRTRTATSPGR